MFTVSESVVTGSSSLDVTCTVVQSASTNHSPASTYQIVSCVFISYKIIRQTTGKSVKIKWLNARLVLIKFVNFCLSG